ncbi:MAG: DUF349 domain-containing protein, partial [Myxococcota bacterium]
RPPSRTELDQETLAWVAVPKFEALLASVTEALAVEPPDRAALIAVRLRVGREWAALLPIPAAHAERLGAAYADRLDALSARIAALPDPRVEEEARSVATREGWIAEAEALLTEPNLAEAVNRAKALQKTWKDAPRLGSAGAAKSLGNRFRAAIDGVFARRASERDERVTKLTALVDQAEVLTRSADPDKAAEVMKQLQGRWKSVGGVGGEQGDALWTRFRAAADAVFERRRAAAADSEQANLAAREALIAQAAALAAEGVDDPDEAIRQLQNKWRRIGHVSRDRSDALWTAFKQACDRLRSPPPVDPASLGEGGALRFNPFAALSEPAPPSSEPEPAPAEAAPAEPAPVSSVPTSPPGPGRSDEPDRG